MKRILLVEDDLDLGENIKEILIASDYDVVKVVTNGSDCLKYLEENSADLILMDILIEGNIDGIDLTYKIKQELNIPIVFITAYSDKTFLDRISKILYDGYLLKPFGIQRLLSTVYLAITNFSKPTNASLEYKKSLSIRDKGFIVPVPINEIAFLKADGLYTKICTKSKSYLIRDILKDVKGKLPEDKFIRVHKSYTVNLEHIESFNSKEIMVNNEIIPIRRGFYKELIKLIFKEPD